MEFTSRQLRAFHLVAEHESFARAAERMFLTPSGLSVLIRELERQLGFRLFDRTTRQVALTGYGRDLLASTQPALKTLDIAMSRIEQASKGQTRTISVGSTPWIAANVLPPRDPVVSPTPARPEHPSFRRRPGHRRQAGRSGQTGSGFGRFREDAGHTGSAVFSLFAYGRSPRQEG
jgi:Bacterial regulatory helix-turn-helix protein, lysR family